MKYPQLIESCRKAISEGRCLGCQALENPYFIGNIGCEYSKTPIAKESISKIHKILETGEQLKI